MGQESTVRIGRTFYVSNLGMMGIPKFTAIINPPNAAILAVGTTVAKPVVKNGQVIAGQTLTVTLSCDHRVFDGAVGAQFLGAWQFRRGHFLNVDKALSQSPHNVLQSPAAHDGPTIAVTSSASSSV